MSGQSGETLDTLSLGLSAPKVILSSDGSTAYINAAGELSDLAPGEVLVVNTASLTVTGSLTMRAGLTIQDIALSPDNSTLYVSVLCTNSYANCSGHSGACTVVTGICVFNASSLALTGTVGELSGYLAVSQNGDSLYVSEHGPAAGGFYIVNTSMLSVSSRELPADPYFSAVMNPAAGYAIILTPESSQSSTTAYILNTSTNKFVAKLFSNAPYGGQVGGHGALSPAALAPDGKSFWMLLSCDGALPTCTLPYQRNLVGIAFPSGTQIGTTAQLPTDVSSIAFPQ